jgi:hypothetical protein
MDDCCSWTEPHGESLCGCSHCGGAVDEAKECEICGEYCAEDDLTNGVCKYCAIDEITYESALEYIKSKKMLRKFFLEYYWDAAKEAKEDEGSDVSALDLLLEQTYLERVKTEKILGARHFFETIKDYILDDVDAWTEFLAKGVNENENAKG